MAFDGEGRWRVRRRPLVRFQLLVVLAAVILAAPVVQEEIGTTAPDPAEATASGAR